MTFNVKFKSLFQNNEQLYSTRIKIKMFTFPVINYIFVYLDIPSGSSSFFIDT